MLRASLIALSLSIVTPAFANPVFETKDYRIRTVTVADGLEFPWSVAFLPGGGYLVTERGGALRIVADDGTVGAPVSGLPAIWAEGQGGLLDVAIGPTFVADQTIFFTFSEPDASGDQGGTALARATLDVAANTVSNVKVLFSQTPKSSGGRHFGSRIVFGLDGTVFITTGDRGERDTNQDTSINRGQVIRLNQDGSIPADNPFANGGALRPEVWSMGHRNPQGAARHPMTGKLWLHEHGARGGDEINVPLAGKNYGWPVIAYGRHYFGGSIGEGQTKDGMEQPIYYWDPSIAPSGMTFYTGDVFPKWKGSLFVGALKFQLIARLTLDGETITAEERILEGLDERIRDVRQGPDGYLYILIDSGDGKLIRLEPAN